MLWTWQSAFCFRRMWGNSGLAKKLSVWRNTRLNYREMSCADCKNWRAKLVNWVDKLGTAWKSKWHFRVGIVLGCSNMQCVSYTSYQELAKCLGVLTAVR